MVCKARMHGSGCSKSTISQSSTFYSPTLSFTLVEVSEKSTDCEAYALLEVALVWGPGLLEGSNSKEGFAFVRGKQPKIFS